MFLGKRKRPKETPGAPSDPQTLPPPAQRQKTSHASRPSSTPLPTVLDLASHVHIRVHTSAGSDTDSSFRPCVASLQCPIPVSSVGNLLDFGVFSPPAAEGAAHEPEKMRVLGEVGKLEYNGSKPKAKKGQSGFRPLFAVASVSADGRMDIFPETQTFAVSRRFKSEVAAAMGADEEDDDEGDENDAFFNIAKYQTAKHLMYEKRRSEGGPRMRLGGRGLSSMAPPGVDVASVQIERRYLPPYNENATAPRGVFRKTRMISQAEAKLIESHLKGVDRDRIEEYPRLFVHFLPPLPTSDADADVGPSPVRVLSKTRRKLLNYYKYLMYFALLNRRYGRRGWVDERTILKDEQKKPSVLAIHTPELWDLMAAKYGESKPLPRRGSNDDSNRKLWRFSGVMFQKVCCYAIAVSLHLADYVLFERMQRRLCVDLGIRLDMLRDFGKAMGLKSIHKKKKDDEDESEDQDEESVGRGLQLKVPWKLPGVLGLQTKGGRRRGKKKTKKKLY